MAEESGFKQISAAIISLVVLSVLVIVAFNITDSMEASNAYIYGDENEGKTWANATNITINKAFWSGLSITNNTGALIPIGDTTLGLNYTFYSDQQIIEPNTTDDQHNGDVTVSYTSYDDSVTANTSSSIVNITQQLPLIGTIIIFGFILFLAVKFLGGSVGV